MTESYVKLYRKILTNPISSRPSWAWLWCVILMKANWEEKQIIWNGDVLKLQPGQFITGRKALSKQTGIKPSTIEDILKYLEKQQQIRQQSNNRFRIITIVNWKAYQSNDVKSDSKSNNQPTTSRQPADTDKNVKNYKNVKKERAFSPPSLSEVKDYCLIRKNNVDAQNFVDFYESKGWVVGKTRMKDWRAAVRTWENRETKQKPKELTWRGQKARINFGTYQVFSGGCWLNLDPKYIKDVIEK